MRVTTEIDFHNLLDANPEDWHTRLVFADWLDEHGDQRAAGYRAIAIQKRRPLQGRHLNQDTWWWHSRSQVADSDDFHNVIPPDWFGLLPPGDGNPHFWPVFSSKGGIKSRRQCEDALALAFAKLPAERQAELHTPPTPARRK